MKTIEESRERPEEQQRIHDLLDAISGDGGSVLDIGTRDGYVARLLTTHFADVVALDLCKPDIQHPRITCVEGNVISLPFPDSHFDTVVCAEVLEHITPSKLAKACNEISRVASRKVFIGVPYKQDTRIGRTTCSNCKKKNPPYGHVNRFDERNLKTLFPEFHVERISYIGKTTSRTTWLATMFMDFAGNPWGTYDQEEPCIHCGTNLVRPQRRTTWQRILSKLACNLISFRQLLTSPQPSWIHITFEKPQP